MEFIDYFYGVSYLLEPSIKEAKKDELFLILAKPVGQQRISEVITNSKDQLGKWTKRFGDTPSYEIVKAIIEIEAKKVEGIEISEEDPVHSS